MRNEILWEKGFMPGCLCEGAMLFWVAWCFGGYLVERDTFSVRRETSFDLFYCLAVENHKNHYQKSHLSVLSWMIFIMFVAQTMNVVSLSKTFLSLTLPLNLTLQVIPKIREKLCE